MRGRSEKNVRKGSSRCGEADLEKRRRGVKNLGNESCGHERLIDLKTELSAVVASGAGGIGRSFPVSENRHRNGILDVSIVPARVTPALSKQGEVLSLLPIH